jgi:hypothetical protein
VNGETRTRTGDTTIFSRVLYQLSYLASGGKDTSLAAREDSEHAGATEPLEDPGQLGLPQIISLCTSQFAGGPHIGVAPARSMAGRRAVSMNRLA